MAIYLGYYRWTSSNHKPKTFNEQKIDINETKQNTKIQWPEQEKNYKNNQKAKTGNTYFKCKWPKSSKRRKVTEL